MSAALTRPIDASLVEAVVMHGDLARLQPSERVAYYARVCESIGVNPLTKPFEYLSLNGRLVLYALRSCTDQLRQIHRVSITITSRDTISDVHIVTARAALPDGRTDESTGAVSIAGLKGESLANALMKAETKAKRRVTLCVCGLGMLDESELDTIHTSAITPRGAIDEDKARAQKAEDDDAATEWMRMVDALADADDLARWCHYHGHLLHGIHATAKARVWRRIMAAWERCGVSQQDVRKWLAESREPKEEIDA
jgi:hypothetical protein